jgi:hypothetical protein
MNDDDVENGDGVSDNNNVVDNAWDDNDERI